MHVRPGFTRYSACAQVSLHEVSRFYRVEDCVPRTDDLDLLAAHLEPSTLFHRRLLARPKCPESRKVAGFIHPATQVDAFFVGECEIIARFVGGACRFEGA